MLKTAVALTTAIIFGAGGDILLSAGMKRLGEVQIDGLKDIFPLLRKVFANKCVLMGVLSMALYFGSYIAALAWVDVSVANPLTALSYFLAALYARFIMREKISTVRAVGIGLIMLGAIFVGASS